MNSIHSTAAILLLVAPGLAQSVSASVTTTTPILARIHSSVLGITQQQSVPANTSGFGFLPVGTGGALATSQWDAFAHETEGRVYWQQKVEVQESTPSFAETGGEMLAHLSAPAPTPVQLELSRILALTPGAIAPVCSIDVSDDGMPEVTAWAVAPVYVNVTLGPQPLPIRLRSFLFQLGQGAVDVELRVRVLPGTAPIIVPIGAGCTGGPGGLATPTFVGEGVAFTPFGADPLVWVFGLGLQPLVIPSPLPAPCWLLPSPDLLVVAGSSAFTLPLPAAVRPVTVWVQGVVVMPTGLATTDGWSLRAL